MVRSLSATSSMNMVSVARLSSTASVSVPPSSYLYRSITSMSLRLFSPVHPPSSAVAAMNSAAAVPRVLLFFFIDAGCLKQIICISSDFVTVYDGLRRSVRNLWKICDNMVHFPGGLIIFALG